MKTISLGRVVGVPLFADWSAGLVIAWLVMSQSGPGGEGFGLGLGFGVLVLGSILVHELGHAVAGRRLGLTPRAILLHGFGGLCQYDRAPRGLQGALVSAAGPAVGLLLGGASALVFIGGKGLLPDLAGWALVNLAVVNIFWSLFNLLPMFPLDGGHVVFHALEVRWGAARARQVARVLSLITAVAVGAWALFSGQVFILIVVALVVLQNLPFSRR